MILKTLNDLAIREELVPDPDFEIKPVAWIIRVGKGGLFQGFYPLKQSEMSRSAGNVATGKAPVP